jgi:Alpha/beta hydrolase family
MTRAALVCGILAAIAASTHGQAPTDYPPQGRLIDVGGRKLHLHCTGSGSPTVLLVAGGGAYAIDWALVQPRVAETTRVCSYDRAGLGWSDPGPADETVEQTVADLRALLQASGEKGPYVPVGASIAGIYIRAYQRAFPDDVAALVFTNSANRVGLATKGGGGLIWDLTEDDLRSAYPLPATTKGPRPTSIGTPFDRLPADLQPVRVWFTARQWERFDPATTTGDSVFSWRREFLREFEETDGNGLPLGTLPVVVVASDPVASEADRASRAGAAARLDFLSSNSLHIQATGSGHEIHLFQPASVIDGIARAVSAVRTRAPLSGRQLDATTPRAGTPSRVRASAD